jgi:hypothetical protein
MAPAAVPRLYHSTALLLPDGRVFTAGGGHPTFAGDTDHFNAEIYSPPYLFAGPRPTVTSSPGSVSFGQKFSVTTPNASSITKATWVRLGSATHGFDASQRITQLSFTPTATGLTLTAPADGTLSPAGYYMLFLVNSHGVPSIAQMIRIGAS